MNPPTTERNPYIFFAIAALSLLMGGIDANIVAVAIPTLTAALHTSLAWVGWTITAFALAQIIATPIASNLSDKLGRKRVFMVCVGTFTLGSLLSGLAPNIWLMIFFRAIEGLGAGGLMPSAIGVVSDQFKEARSKPIGLLISVVTLGAIIGPNVGAWILDHWTWRAIYFVNVPVGLIVLIGAQLVLREQRRTVKSAQIDFRGLAMFAPAIIALMYSMTVIGNDPTALRSPLPWILLALAVLLFWQFVRHERRAANPIVDMALVFPRPFMQVNLYNVLYGSCLWGFSAFTPYVAVIMYKMTTAQSGAVLAPRALAMLGMSAIASLLLTRLGYRLPIVGGTIIAIVGLIALTFGWSGLSMGPLTLDTFWLLALMLMSTGVAVGMISPATSNASIDLSPGRAAALSGLRDMFGRAGGIIAVSATTLTLSFFADKSLGIRMVMLGYAAALLLFALPLALAIPDGRQRPKASQVASPSPVEVLDRT